MILNIDSGELNGPKSIFLKKDKVWTSKASLSCKILKKNAIEVNLLLFTHSVVSDSLWPQGLQHTRLPVHHLLQLAQTHVHWFSDAIQPSCPLSSPSLPAPNPSQHQGLFQWVSSSLQEVKVSELQFQHQSFQWIFRFDVLQNWLVWSPCHLRDPQESSLTPQWIKVSTLGDYLYLKACSHWLFQW